MNAHEWIEAKGRRWCIGCDAIQRKRAVDAKRIGYLVWWPVVPDECPRSTFAARAGDHLTSGGEALTSKP